MAPSRPIRVLIVDDHPMVREGLRSMLSVPEIAVVGDAATADEALQRAAEFRPDVVMLDVQLAADDGLTVLKRLKAARPQTSVLIAAVQAVREGESVLDPAVLKDALTDAAERRPPGAAADPLTRIETEVLQLLAAGLTNREIGERMRWSLGTAKKYVQRVLEKLQVSDRTQAAVEAVRRGLVGLARPPAP